MNDKTAPAPAYINSFETKLKLPFIPFLVSTVAEDVRAKIEIRGYTERHYLEPNHWTNCSWEEVEATGEVYEVED